MICQSLALRVQAVLAGLERPLLCSSVHVEAGAGALELPEAAVMLDMFEPKGIDFVVDAGVTVRASPVGRAVRAWVACCQRAAPCARHHMCMLRWYGVLGLALRNPARVGE
jgi:hypothetical protein